MKYKQEKGRYPKVFLSGAISKRLDTYKTYFDAVEVALKNVYSGIEVYNPAYMPADIPWEEAMKETLGNLGRHNLVYVLKDWEGSVGVNIEVAMAEILDIPVIYQ